jgi:acyl dehydratase
MEEPMSVDHMFDNVIGVTDEHVREAQALVGSELRVVGQYNQEASLDSVRHYAHGIGDDNPLWCDEQYAAEARFGTIVAPPTFLYSIWQGTCGPGLRGLHPMQGGSQWTWRRLPRRGERIYARSRVVAAEERQGRNAHRMIVQKCETNYFTSPESHGAPQLGRDGELLAKLITSSIRTARPGADGELKYEKQTPRAYSEAELKAIEAAVFAEECRGATPRLWEDVNEGDELVPVVKGPLDQLTMTCYYQGVAGSPGYKGCELRWKQWRLAEEHPEELPNNFDITYFRERVLPSLGHQNDDVARAVGMPAAYDNGLQRTAWIAHAVTNWMGDGGFLRSLNVELRRPNIFGNTTWCGGRVVRKFSGSGRVGVDLELWGTTQDKEVNTKGTAQVYLPSRELGPTMDQYDI